MILAIGFQKNTNRRSKVKGCKSVYYELREGFFTAERRKFRCFAIKSRWVRDIKQTNKNISESPEGISGGGGGGGIIQ